MESLTKRRREIDDALADTGIYSAEARERLQSLLTERSQLQSDLARAEDDWLNLTAQIETHSG